MEQKLIYAELEVAANLTHEVLLSELALNDFTRDLYQDLEVEIVEKLSIWNGTLQTFVNDKLAEIISTNTNTNFDAKKTAVQTSVDAYKAGDKFININESLAQRGHFAGQISANLPISLKKPTQLQIF